VCAGNLAPVAAGPRHSRPRARASRRRSLMRSLREAAELSSSAASLPSVFPGSGPNTGRLTPPLAGGGAAAAADSGRGVFFGGGEGWVCGVLYVLRLEADDDDAADDEPCRDRRTASCRSCSESMSLKWGPVAEG
jgi:hypothetical protein